MLTPEAQEGTDSPVPPTMRPFEQEGGRVVVRTRPRTPTGAEDEQDTGHRTEQAIAWRRRHAVLLITAVLMGGAFYVATVFDFGRMRVRGGGGGDAEIREESESSTGKLRRYRTTAIAEASIHAVHGTTFGYDQLMSRAGIGNDSTAYLEQEQALVAAAMDAAERAEHAAQVAQEAAAAAEAAAARSGGGSDNHASSSPSTANKKPDTPSVAPPANPTATPTPAPTSLAMPTCNDAFDLHDVAMTHCRLVTCDTATSTLSRTTTYTGQSCQTDKWIDRNPVHLQPEEEKANQEIGHQDFDFVFYPGAAPDHVPNCQEWFFRGSDRFSRWFNEYLSRRIPTSGISKRVYYNSARAKGDRHPKMIYIYAAATRDDYQKEMTKFNLKQVHKAFGDDAFIIFVEGSDFNDFDLFKDQVDVIVHANFVTSEIYYDDAMLQEGVLEAYRIFGKDLMGIEMLAVINDSLMGPMDLKIYDKWKAANGEDRILSVAAWRNTILTGAGMAFTRPALENRAFQAFWSMALWEGTVYSYFAGHGSGCLVSTNNIDDISTAQHWENVLVPYYKHRNKHGQDGKSVYQTHMDRVGRASEAGQEVDRSITQEDRFGQPEEGVDGKELEGCQMKQRYTDFPPVDGRRRRMTPWVDWLG